MFNYFKHHFYYVSINSFIYYVSVNNFLEQHAELRMNELELQNKTVKPQPLDFGIHFDVTKHIRFVPPFQEKAIDKYFLHFEKVAENLKWPKEHWTLLLQGVIIGKAREIYTQLTVE